MLNCFRNFILPSFDWIQVEVTTYCNARCNYCPRTIYGKEWINRHLTYEYFEEKLTPILKKCKLVYLQGWGEPFLNPDFLKMINLSKKLGCKVGTTTNGILIDRQMAEKIVLSGLDIIAFSLAGTDEENDSIREGTTLKKVLEAIQLINEYKISAGSNTPHIHIAYIILKSQLSKILKISDILSGYDVNQVVVSTLDFVPSPELKEEVIVLEQGATATNILLDLAKKAGPAGLNIFYADKMPNVTMTSCAENPLKSLFISASGEVSPCVFLNIPTGDNARSIHKLKHLSFGSLGRETLAGIWFKKEFIKFRRQFVNQTIPPICKDCPKLY